MGKKSVKGSEDGFSGKRSGDALSETGTPVRAKNIFPINMRNVIRYPGNGVTGRSGTALPADELRMPPIRADDLDADNMHRNIESLFEPSNQKRAYYFIKKIDAATLMEILRKR